MSHHAQLIRTDSFADFLYQPEGQESVVQIQNEKFGVDEARSLYNKAQLRPVNSVQQVFIIKTGFITHEAQNALLKLFEEPPADTFFVLVIPPAFQILPTLHSRIGEERRVDQPNNSDSDVWQTFKQASPAERIKQIDLWQKSKDKDPQWLSDITAGVHAIDIGEVPASALPVIQLVGERLQTRGASNKMLLEHLALALPLLK